MSSLVELPEATRQPLARPVQVPQPNPLDTQFSPANSPATRPEVSRLNASVSEVVKVNDKLLIIKIAPDNGVPSFKAGQFVSLGLFSSAPSIAEAHKNHEGTKDPLQLIERAYSIASSPDQNRSLEFCISIVPNGELTSRVALLAPGERISVRPKVTGKFTLDGIPDDKDLLMISTGTGITPFMSMLRSNSTWTPGRHVTLVHGVRSESDLVYRDELMALAKSGKPFTYVPTVSREEPTLPGVNKGRVTKMLEQGTVKADPARDIVLLCGNPEMIEGADSIKTMLAPHGFAPRDRRNPEGNLMYEKFW